MIPLVVIIDLHCDATMPSGAQEFGGGNTYTRNLVLGLLKAECHFLYITRKKYGFLEYKVPLAPHGTLYRIDLGDFGADDKDKLQEHYDEALTQIERILKEYPSSQYSFVFHSCYWQSGHLARILAARYQTYFVHSVLSSGKSKASRGAVSDLAEGRISTEEVVFRDARYIVCSSDSERQDVARLYGIASGKLVVTGRWVDIRYRHPLYLGSGAVSTNSLGGQAPVHYLPLQEFDAPKRYTGASAWWQKRGFLYLGRIHENKGVPEIITAWLNLYKKFGEITPPLWLAGGSPPQIDQMRAYLGERMSELRAAERASKLIWWGTLDPAGISTLLLKTMALLMHSKYEAGGIIIMEAMCQEVPVIATPYGYAKNCVEDWRNGFLVPFGDTESLRRRMEHFVYHPYLSNVLGRHARLTAERITDSWSFIESHLRLYGLTGAEAGKAPPNEERPDTISVYPYLSQEFAADYLKGLAERWTREACGKFRARPVDARMAYREWEAVSASGKLTLLAFDDLFLWSPLWRAGEGVPLLTKYQRAKMASLAGETGYFPPVLGADHSQGLVLRRAATDMAAGTPERLSEKLDMLDAVFDYRLKEEDVGLSVPQESPFSLRSAASHLTRMADELREWTPQAAQALTDAVAALVPAAELERNSASEIGLSVLGLNPEEACLPERSFVRSPQAIFLRSTWGMGHALFLLRVCETYCLPVEPYLTALPAERQAMLRGWLRYFSAVRTLLDAYNIPEAFAFT